MKYLVHFRAGKKQWYYKKPLSQTESEFTAARREAMHFHSADSAQRLARLLSMKHIQLRGRKLAVLSYGGKSVRTNPSARSRGLAEEAAHRYEAFTGHKAGKEYYFQDRRINVGLAVGKLSGVMYEATRDGKTEQYFHRFKKSSRPLLIADHDGSRLGIVGGRYHFTERGIEDR